MAPSPWLERVSSQPSGSYAEPRLFREVSPTVVPESTLPVTFLHCSGVLPSLKLLFL